MALTKRHFLLSYINKVNSELQTLISVVLLGNLANLHQRDEAACS